MNSLAFLQVAALSGNRITVSDELMMQMLEGVSNSILMILPLAVPVLVLVLGVKIIPKVWSAITHT